MQADAEALQVIGQNIANTESIAYRRQIAVDHVSFDSAVDALAQADLARVAVDLRPGTLRSTGEPLHVALEGAGFFALQEGEGVTLTRRGDFHVSQDGILTSADGKAVLGLSGPIEVGASVPTIESDGSVKIGADVIGQLRLINVAEPRSLQYLGDGKFTAQPDELIETNGALTRQGYLESSNVAPVVEMVRLMETVRHFEASQKMMRGYDDMMQKAISELGKTGS
jgi:flagellar basal-body rod protein FlgG